MIKKLLSAIIACSIVSGTALARHSNYSPMAPRQISVQDSHKDYSFGLTILPGNSIDSIEVFNRNGPWNLNYYILDGYILSPTAHAYAKLPSFMKSGVHNFFSNITDLTSTVDNLLVGEAKASGQSLLRFSLNSTIGILGLVDVASYMGIEANQMAMATVLGRAGVDQGHYFMVPFMGPVSERELHGRYFDDLPYFFAFHFPYGLGVKFIDLIDTRASLIPQEDILANSADPYAQMRQIVLMYREGKVNPDAAMNVKADDNIDEFLDEIDE